MINVDFIFQDGFHMKKTKYVSKIRRRRRRKSI